MFRLLLDSIVNDEKGESERSEYGESEWFNQTLRVLTELCDEVTTKETGASKDGCNVSTHCTSSGDTITNDRFARGQSGNISQTTLYKFHTQQE